VNEEWEKSKSFFEISWRNDRTFDWYGFTKNVGFGKLSTSLINTLICCFELKLVRIEKKKNKRNSHKLNTFHY
jgi:hypothetical protein